MGGKVNKQERKKHIYNDLNKSIDSFTSCDDYANSGDNDRKMDKRRRNKNKHKTKYKLKSHKKINDGKNINSKLIESSLLVSDFLINNIINKKTGQRPLPDTNLVNSLLLFPDLCNYEELEFDNQIECCDQLIFKGVNYFRKEYKEFDMNQKKDFSNNNPVSTNKIFINKINKTNNTNYNNDNTKSYDVKDEGKNNNEDMKKINLYKPRQMKDYFGRKKKKILEEIIINIQK